MYVPPFGVPLKATALSALTVPVLILPVPWVKVPDVWVKLPLIVKVLVVDVNVPPESVKAPVSLIAAEPPTKLPVDTILPVVTAPEP